MAIALAGRDDLHEVACDEPRVHPEIDEAGSRDLDVAHTRGVQPKRLDERARDVDRLPSQRPREQHGEIGRPVAVRRIARPLEQGLLRIGRAKLPRRPTQLGADLVGRSHSVEDFPGFDAGASEAFDSLGAAGAAGLDSTADFDSDEAAVPSVAEPDVLAPDESDPPSDFTFDRPAACWSFFPSLP